MTTDAPSTFRAAQVAEAGGGIELVERELRDPGPGEVRIAVQACGICHSDAFTVDGLMPGIRYPRIPGHEVAGVIDALGDGVKGWKAGQRVGVGWFGGHCHRCERCRRGDLVNCRRLQIPGISFDGGWAESMVVSADALASLPDELADADAAPLLCAGVTTYNALRRSVARPGDTVAILGIGGLGHLGVQFAARMGFRVVAIARGRDKEPLARELGAHEYVDSTEADVAKALRGFGGASVVLATVTNAAAMSATIGGLTARGQLLVVGAAAEPIEVSPLQLLSGVSITGHPSGTAQDSEDTLGFSDLTGIRPMVETVPLEQAGDAYAKMMAGDARFRMVLTTGR